MKPIELDEVIINGALIKHDSRSDEYRLTQELTQGATSAYDVLSRLPGITYNNISNSVSVRMDNNVIIKVNGNNVSPEYIQALPVDAISKIQVVYAPEARYTTEGIRYVINIKLKKDAEGHSLYIGNSIMVSAGKNNGSDIIANEQPKGQYIYSNKKIDITAGYGFASIHWNYPIEYSKSYAGITSLQTGAVNAHNPNDFNSTYSNAANLGINWELAPYQTLSFLGTFQADRTKHSSVYDLYFEHTPVNRLLDYTEHNIENSKIKDIAGAVYYQGMFENGWNVFAGFGYNRYQDNFNSEYSGFDSHYNSLYRNRRNYWRGEVDVNYSFNDLLSLNFGYRGIWNRYSTLNREDWSVLSKYTDDHHNTYLFLDWSPSENILFHIGSGMEAIKKGNLTERHNWIEVLPHISATWQPSDKFQLMAEYQTKMEYPSIFQTSEASINIDRWLSMIGNSGISPARKQMISFQGTVLESIIFGAEYNLMHNHISEWYEKKGEDEFTKTFINARSQELRLIAGYDWRIIKGLVWQNIFQWKWGGIKGRGFSNHTSNISWESKINYWIQPIGLLASIEYSREMEKLPLLQGWQQFGQDLWQISLKKSVLDDSLSFSINYIPPFHLGVRTSQESFIKTDFMDLSQRLNLRTYDNLMILRIEWRFNKGRNKKRHIQPYEFETEQKQGKGLL
ncbi:MAG: hypothetical protein K2J82_06995 [Muribaculaceae bacterium]|nr:hypothetical protein [Muribaculaceae bacterium]